MVDFAQRYGPWALVLGASEGLGAAWSRELARRGCDVVLVARRPEPLDALADELRAAGRQVRVVPMDLARPDLVGALQAAVDGLDLGLVVYNACASFVGPFLRLSEAEKQTTLDVNARGPMLAAHALLPGLVARGRGGMVIVSSLSGFQGSAWVGTYAATKAFDLVLGETLWHELKPQGVDVLVVAAGATLTPAFERVTPEARRKDAVPMQADDVAREGLDALAAGAGPTFVPGRVNRLARAVFSHLPRRWVVGFISRTTRGMYEG